MKANTEQQQFIQEGFALLQKHKHYGQINIVNKLNTLGVILSPTTFNRVLKGHAIKQKTLSELVKAIKIIIRKELGYDFSQDLQLRKVKNEEIEIIPEKKGSQKTSTGFRFHAEGRLSIEQKVAFLKTAKKEIIEFGITLNSFTSYFLNRKDADFKLPLLSILEKGINIKCFLLHPSSNEALHYFNDRKIILPEEQLGVEKIKTTINNLKTIQYELNQYSPKGRFEIYTYKQLPYNYFLSIDGGYFTGKMMTSHYLYGIRRAKCPVMEFTKKDNNTLYNLYWKSLTNLMKDAIPVSAL